MYWIVSVAPVVLVMVTVEADAGTICTGFALVVTSFATQKNVEVEVYAGEIPVMVEALPDSTAEPKMMCAEAAVATVLAHAPLAAKAAPQLNSEGNEPALVGRPIAAPPLVMLVNPVPAGVMAIA